MAAGEGKGCVRFYRDSAAVEIVVNRVPATGIPVYATLDSVPDLDLGFVPGDGASYLSDVRDVVTLQSGEVAVANGLTLEVRFYGPDGTWPGRFYVGDQVALVIGGYDPDGTLRQSIRLEGIDLTLPRSQVDEARAAGQRERGEPANAGRFWDAVGDTRPAHTRLLLDAAGNLWVAEYVAALTPPRNWMVFAPDGANLGLVTVPPGFALREVGVRYVLGVVKGPEGDERVVRYRVNRNR